MRNTLLVASLVFTWVSCPDISAADPIHYSAALNAAHFGDLKQADVPDCPRNACGPTAATNSFQFLETTYPLLYGGRLVRNLLQFDRNFDGIVNQYDALIATADDLAKNYMGTCCPPRNTLRNNLYSGKRTYLEEHAPGRTVYEVMDDPDLNAIDVNWVNPPATRRGAKPTLRWFSANLRSKEDIEILLSRDDGHRLTFGHYVTVTKLQWTDSDLTGTISPGDPPATLSFVDPAGQRAGPGGVPPADSGGIERAWSFNQRADGLLYVTNPHTGQELDIRFAVKESPRPEPSVPTGSSATGSARQTLSFDAVTGTLSLSPFVLTGAYVASALGLLDVDRVDAQFATDALLGALVTVSPFVLGERFSNGRVSFAGFDGLVTISKGSDVFLQAFVPTLMFDPFLGVPFYAPIHAFDLNTSLGSPLLNDMASRMTNPGALPFDLFMSPLIDFAAATANFTRSAQTGVDAGVAQNGTPVPEPSALGLLVLGAAAAATRRRSSDTRSRLALARVQ